MVKAFSLIEYSTQKDNALILGFFYMPLTISYAHLQEKSLAEPAKKYQNILRSFLPTKYSFVVKSGYFCARQELWEGLFCDLRRRKAMIWANHQGLFLWTIPITPSGGLQLQRETLKATEINEIYDGVWIGIFSCLEIHSEWFTSLGEIWYDFSSKAVPPGLMDPVAEFSLKWAWKDSSHQELY